MKVKKWIENFWYHYKWPVIIISFFAVVVAICVSQMLSKENYDMHIRYVGETEITETNYQDIKRAFEKTGLDSNGDEKTVVNFEKVAYISDPENIYKNQINAMARETLSVLISQTYYIYLMDAEVYELYKDSGSFEELSRIFDYDVSDIAYDEYAVRFSETEFCKNSPGMEWVEDDIVMVLKIAPYKISPDIKKDPKEVESFEFHRELFKLMAEG